ncbi:hypothetical protein AB0I75_31805 [Streptomyces sp. NPDC050273]|uniref:hypothetical protein n=1 Tax=Streptomyces sp. NPDC050273 TaxID=3154933 RepID=UPI0034327E22
MKASRWKKSSWTGDNGRAPGLAVETLWGHTGRAPGVAVETLWGHTGRAGGPKLPEKTLVCTQFKGSKKKACYRLP